jgi:hypothetical protein
MKSNPTGARTQPIRTKATGTPQRFTPARAGLLQRKCACGGTPGLTGECATCREKGLQRGSEPGVAIPRLARRLARLPLQGSGSPGVFGLAGGQLSQTPADPTVLPPRIGHGLQIGERVSVQARYQPRPAVHLRRDRQLDHGGTRCGNPGRVVACDSLLRAPGDRRRSLQPPQLANLQPVLDPQHRERLFDQQGREMRGREARDR